MASVEPCLLRGLGAWSGGACLESLVSDWGVFGDEVLTLASMRHQATPLALVMKARGTREILSSTTEVGLEISDGHWLVGKDEPHSEQSRKSRKS